MCPGMPGCKCSARGPAPCLAAVRAAQKPEWLTRISVILMQVVPEDNWRHLSWDTSEHLAAHLDPLLQPCRLHD